MGDTYIPEIVQNANAMDRDMLIETLRRADMRIYELEERLVELDESYGESLDRYRSENNRLREILDAIFSRDYVKQVDVDNYRELK